jgi:hypothetical protein
MWKRLFCWSANTGNDGALLYPLSGKEAGAASTLCTDYSQENANRFRTKGKLEPLSPEYRLNRPGNCGGWLV